MQEFVEIEIEIEIEIGDVGPGTGLPGVRPPRDVLAVVVVVVVVVVIESANEDDYDNDYDNDNERPSCNSQYHMGFTSFRSHTRCQGPTVDFDFDFDTDFDANRMV